MQPELKPIPTREGGFGRAGTPYASDVAAPGVVSPASFSADVSDAETAGVAGPAAGVAGGTRVGAAEVRGAVWPIDFTGVRLGGDRPRSAILMSRSSAWISLVTSSPSKNTTHGARFDFGFCACTK